MATILPIPGMGSTLSLPDLAGLLDHMNEHHSQSQLEILSIFCELFQSVACDIKERENHDWVIIMTESVRTYCDTQKRLILSGADVVTIRVCTSILALGCAVDFTPTLDIFRKNAIEIVQHSKSCRGLSEVNRGICSSMISAVFSFWLSFDQLCCIKQTKKGTEEAISNGLTRMANDHPHVAQWIDWLMREKFAEGVNTILQGDKLIILVS